MSAERGNEETKGPEIGARSDALAARVALNIARTDLDAARRRALLLKMGTGTAALAVLAPLSAHASGTHKLANSSLPSGFGFCTVSGYQSAAVSGAPATSCSAFAPSHFLTTTELTYSTLGVNGSINAKKLADKLNAKFFAGSSFITEAHATTLLKGVAGTTVKVVSHNMFIYVLTADRGIFLQPNATNLPAVITDTLGTFKSIFAGSLDVRTLLEVLYDGVFSSSPAFAKCYFLSAYLTVCTPPTPSSLPVGFDGDYVKGQYSTDGNAASGTYAYQFFKTLCSMA